MNDSENRGTTVADITSVIAKWKKDCEARGEEAFGSCHFASIDPGTGEASQSRSELIGNKVMVLASTIEILKALYEAQNRWD